MSFPKFVRTIFYRTPPVDYFYKYNVFKTRSNVKENYLMALQFVLATIKLSDLFQNMLQTKTS